MTRGVAVGILLSLALLAGLPAQTRSAERGDRERLLRSLRDRLAEAQLAQERLLDARIRVDLGLQVDDPLLRVDEHTLEVARFGGRTQLDAGRAEVERLARRHAELREQVATAREAVGRRPSGALPAPSGVPRPADLRELVDRARAALTGGDADESARSAEADDGGPAAPAAVRRPPVTTGPDHVIAGIEDRARLGHALLRVGVGLLADAARRDRDGDADGAAELRRAAERRLADALTELAAACAGPEPHPRDRFALARCLEQVGDRVAAENLYIDIMARDQQRAPDGSRSYGTWGRAAATALAVMRWLADTGDWQPRRDPRTIDLGAAK
ncbi:MAG: hypothetical protein IPM29_30900 [Planctomycetes bacterium]|nr:hypothetical protein [Planctomycetota bacterium]